MLENILEKKKQKRCIKYYDNRDDILKHKRKIFTILIFLIIFFYLSIRIVGLMNDIKEKKANDMELKAKILQHEEIYQKLLEEEKLIEEMDPAYIEKLARELGMLKEGEILFEERKD